jgi:hypothetical protein
VFQVGITLEVQLVDDGLNLREMDGEHFGSIRAYRQLFNFLVDIPIEFDRIVRLVLEGHVSIRTLISRAD